MIETVKLNSCCSLNSAEAELEYHPHSSTVKQVTICPDSHSCEAIIDTVEKAREMIALLERFIELKEKK